jgi:CRISPR-associated endonuclease/helicase Cas3
MDRFFAHSGKDSAHFCDWQSLREHLAGVAQRARINAHGACPQDAALADATYAAGLLHDLGKYRPEFQLHIRGLSPPREKTYHKQAGAAKAIDAKNWPVAFSIAGHHGGIPDLVDLKIAAMGEHGKDVASVVWDRAVEDCSELPRLDLAMPRPKDQLHLDLLTRLVFSCLVDADWADTSAHERRCNGRPEEPSPPPLDPTSRLSKVLTHIERRAGPCKEEQIKRVRADVLNACLEQAEHAPGLYSLTVPTGGGKTLAGLSFALKHAAKHDLRRIVYVAPYMSILEQNIGVFRDSMEVGPNALDVFEHYSLAEPPGDEGMNETAREAAARRAENWDAPIIVTTNVQFFESLFSNKPGRCRKLHNIARSVVILDECQTLPPGLVAPTCGMLKQLATDLGCTILLCTATQPAFQHESLKTDERLDAREIIPKGLDLFGRLQRVRLSWPKADDHPLTWTEVAERMCSAPSALCVVNTKKAARAVFDELKNRKAPGLFHLSTAMCPAHRREKLTLIRQRLAKSEPCFVVSTQLIESGVDVDFPFLMRELAPLESIIQAAGRCNREGRIQGEGGRVVVFRSKEGKMPPDRWYIAGRDTLETHFLAQGMSPQIDDPAVIQDYFSRLYHTGALDKERVRPMREKFQFKQVAEAYRLIDNVGQPVVVSRWTSHEAEIATLLGQLRTSPRKALFRELGRFQVNLFPHEVLRAASLIHEESSAVLVWDGAYTEDEGIVEEIADAYIV